MSDSSDRFRQAGAAIVAAQSADRIRAIPYRPQYNLITKSVEGSILLQQLLYWWTKMGGQAFYKFRAPCDHDRYVQGESWTEELGFTPYQFDRAIQGIATKVTKGISKTESRVVSLAIYWTDTDRLTWYEINEPLVYTLVGVAYSEPQLLGNFDPRNYLGNRDLQKYLGTFDPRNYIPQEITQETTQKTTADGASAPCADAHPSKAIQQSMKITDPEQTTGFTSPLDKKLQAVLRAEARSAGRRGPQAFETMAQKQAWRVASEDIIAQSGEAELDKAIHWAMTNGRTSRSRLIATVQAWAHNLKNPKPYNGNSHGGLTKVMTNDEFATWAQNNLAQDPDSVPVVDRDGVPF